MKITQPEILTVASIAVPVALLTMILCHFLSPRAQEWLIGILTFIFFTGAYRLMFRNITRQAQQRLLDGWPGQLDGRRNGAR